MYSEEPAQAPVTLLTLLPIPTPTVRVTADSFLITVLVSGT